MSDCLDLHSSHVPSAEWRVDPDFPEIPLHLLSQSRWSPLVSRCWRDPANILLLEARALLMGGGGSCSPSRRRRAGSFIFV